MPPAPNNHEKDNHMLSAFKTVEEKVIFFQNVVELMWRDGVIKSIEHLQSWNMLPLRLPAAGFSLKFLN
jgi:hypothetical protein